MAAKRQRKPAKGASKGNLERLREVERNAMLRVDTVKSERWNMRVSPEDDALVRAAAAESNESVSDFVLEAARAKAAQTLADRTVFYLDEERWDELMAMLDRPPQYKPALEKLFSRELP